MNPIYETVLLREEFNLVQKLQKDAEFSNYVTVKYEDRVTGEVKPILSTPTADKYPEIYIVDYKMPVYVSEGQLRNDYRATAKITLSEPVLSNRRADHGPDVKWNSNIVPFNKHFNGTTTICSGNAWIVAKDFGLWHFIISMGALVNQDEYVCDPDGGHFNPAANDYWVRRGRKPVTNIKWALDLLTRKTITIVPQTAPPATTTDKPKITILKKTPEQQVQQPVKKITIIKK